MWNSDMLFMKLNTYIHVCKYRCEKKELWIWLLHVCPLYSAHQKSGDKLSVSYYLPLQHHVLSNYITPMHVQTI